LARKKSAHAPSFFSATFHTLHIISPFFDSHSLFVFTEHWTCHNQKREQEILWTNHFVSIFLTSAKQSLFSTNSFLEETEAHSKPNLRFKTPLHFLSWVESVFCVSIYYVENHFVKANVCRSFNFFTFAFHFTCFD
jgi:hypothetical protein